MSNQNYKPCDESYYRNPLYGLPTEETRHLPFQEQVKKPFFSDFEWEWRCKLLNATREETIEYWDMLLNPHKYGFTKNPLSDEQLIEMRRMLCRIDRIYLSKVIIGNNPTSEWHNILSHKWLYDRCREHERNPDGHLDLWPRGHFKSSIAVKLSIIQEHLINPMTSICLFAYEVSFATETLLYIKGVYENNEDLKSLFPEIFYQGNPSKQAGSGGWTSESLKLKTLSDAGQSFPSLTVAGIEKGKTGFHFDKVYFDDIVYRNNCTPSRMKAMRGHITNALSTLNQGEDSIKRFAYVGTRYHRDDPYAWLIDTKQVIPRVYTTTDNKKLDGKPVYLSQARWDEIKKGDPYQIACDHLMNPVTDGTAIFDTTKLKRFEKLRAMDFFILVDPADSKKETSDRTCMIVIGIDNNYNHYIVDGIIDKMEIGERWVALKNLHRKWDAHAESTGRDVHVFYEKFAMNSDIGAMGNFMKSEGYEFVINPVSFGSLGGRATKQMRIRRINADLNKGKVYLPKYVIKPHGGIPTVFEWIIKDSPEGPQIEYIETDIVSNFKKLGLNEDKIIKYKDLHSDKRPVTQYQFPIYQSNFESMDYDFIIELVWEMIDFPYGKHDDGPDAWSRIYDVDLDNLVGGSVMSIISPDYNY